MTVGSRHSPRDTTIPATHQNNDHNEHYQTRYCYPYQYIQQQTIVLFIVTSGFVRRVSATTVVFSVTYFILVDALPVPAFKHSRARAIITSAAVSFIRMVNTVKNLIADEIFVNALSVFALEFAGASSVTDITILFVRMIIAIKLPITDEIFVDALSVLAFKLTVTCGHIEDIILNSS